MLQSDRIQGEMVSVRDQPGYKIEPFDHSHRTWAVEMLAASWGSALVVSRGRVYDASVLPGYIAYDNDQPAGLVTFSISGDACEIVTLNSLVERQGIGSALIEAIRQEATHRGCRRIWLITTNDNLPALHFYQKRGFRLAALYPNALAESRRLKPDIPLKGLYGIPLRDEIELELVIATLI